MLKWIIILGFLFCYLGTYCQEDIGLKSHQDTVKKLINLIKIDQLLSTPAVGAGGHHSKPFYRFIYLLSIVKTEELIAMVNDTSRYLRTYGYIGLLHRKHPDAKKVQKRLLGDTTLIETISGCNAESMPIAKAVRNIKWWYYRKGFDILLREEITPNYVGGYSIKTLLIE